MRRFSVLLEGAPAPTTSTQIAAAAIDPTALAILSIFGGAALAGAFALLGIWFQGRREHRRWLREKRHDAFVELRRIFGELNHVDREQELAGMMGDSVSISRQIARRAELEADLRNSVAELYIAPEVVRKAAAWYALKRGQGHSPQQEKDAQWSLEQAMRKTLGVRD